MACTDVLWVISIWIQTNYPYLEPSTVLKYSERETVEIFRCGHGYGEFSRENCMLKVLSDSVSEGTLKR